jgi:hypothetical protein
MKNSKESRLVSFFVVSIEDIAQVVEDCMADFSNG